MHPGAGIAPGCIFGGAIPRLKLTYESMGPFGRKALTDFEHDVVTSGRSREGCCDSSISGPRHRVVLHTRATQRRQALHLRHAPRHPRNVG